MPGDFVDRVLLHATGATAGTAAPPSAARSSPLAGPDGANGGPAAASSSRWMPQETTPAVVPPPAAPPRRERHRRAWDDMRQGRNGEDLVIAVPDGTVVRTEDGAVLADLMGAGARFVAAAGGGGGLGNAVPRVRNGRKASGFALLGEPGDEVRRRPRTEVGGRRRARWLPVGRQVVADRGDLGRAPEDRRLSVHHAGAQPGRRRRRGHRGSRWRTSRA